MKKTITKKMTSGIEKDMEAVKLSDYISNGERSSLVQTMVEDSVLERVRPVMKRMKLTWRGLITGLLKAWLDSVEAQEAATKKR